MNASMTSFVDELTKVERLSGWKPVEPEIIQYNCQIINHLRTPQPHFHLYLK